MSAFKIGDKVQVLRGKSANKVGIIIDMDKKYANVKYLRSDKISTLKQSNLKLYQEEEVQEVLDPNANLKVVMSEQDKVKHFLKNINKEIEQAFEEGDEAVIPLPNGVDDFVFIKGDEEKKEKEEEMEEQFNAIEEAPNKAAEPQEEVSDTNTITGLDALINAYKEAKKSMSFEEILSFGDYISGDMKELMDIVAKVNEWRLK